MLQLAGSAPFVGLTDHVRRIGDDEEPPRPPDWCVDEYDEPVEEAYETAESIDGVERDPDELHSRHEVAYQCHPQGYQLCANCEYFIPAMAGDTVGACAIVDGGVRSQDWCGLYSHTDRLDEAPDPNPLG